MKRNTDRHIFYLGAAIILLAALAGCSIIDGLRGEMPATGLDGGLTDANTIAVGGDVGGTNEAGQPQEDATANTDSDSGIHPDAASEPSLHKQFCRFPMNGAIVEQDELAIVGMDYDFTHDHLYLIDAQARVQGFQLSTEGDCVLSVISAFGTGGAPGILELPELISSVAVSAGGKLFIAARVEGTNNTLVAMVRNSQIDPNNACALAANSISIISENSKRTELLAVDHGAFYAAEFSSMDGACTFLSGETDWKPTDTIITAAAYHPSRNSIFVALKPKGIGPSQILEIDVMSWTATGRSFGNLMNTNADDALITVSGLSVCADILCVLDKDAFKILFFHPDDGFEFAIDLETDLGFDPMKTKLVGLQSEDPHTIVLATSEQSDTDPKEQIARIYLIRVPD
jgi:hypothetical protein